jgi:heme-degrading monooxygenase HmoA
MARAQRRLVAVPALALAITWTFNQLGVGEGSRKMILEVAILDIRQSEEAAFETAFAQAQKIIQTMPGYLGHELKRCVENSSRYLLLVRWRTLTDHTEGFRGSPEYQVWKAQLHRFYDPFPIVEHYEIVAGMVP